jgi:tRNA(adenine34) deaminase
MGFYKSNDSSDLRNQRMIQNFSPYMKICEKLATNASAKGNTAVGSLLIYDNNIVAQAEEAAFSKQDISCHAELEVIKKARKILGKDMAGAILVTTNEPCVMCSYAIRFHRISTVVFKIKSEWVGGASSSFNLLTSKAVPPTWGDPIECILLNN